MAEYINRDELIKGLVENDPVRIAVLCEPTADVAPVVHGKWNRTTSDYECSNCQFQLAYIWITPHCPNCGAKMDVEG